jgi:hypothetical protein
VSAQSYIWKWSYTGLPLGLLKFLHKVIAKADSDSFI